MNRKTATGVLETFRLANDVYSLRPPKGTRRVTIRHQQTRACNLIHSLAVCEKLDRGAAQVRLCIVGAGVAGITAASFARRLGVEERDILVLERQEVEFWNLRHGHTRWLHPHWFLWPESGWDREETLLPVHNWCAAYAEHVARQIEYDVDVGVMKPVEDVKVDARMTPALVTFKEIARNSAIGTPKSVSASIVIVADGLGLERRDPNAVNSSYWLDDNVHREEPYVDGHVRLCVVGNGDGALTDILRARLTGGVEEWGQREVLEFAVRTLGPKIERGVRRIERDYESKLGAIGTAPGAAEDVRKLLTRTAERYQALLAKSALKSLIRDLPDRALTLVDQVAEAPFGEPTFPAHRALRMLVGTLWPDQTRLISGRGQGSARLPSDGVTVEFTRSGGIAPRSPDHHRGHQLLHVDRLVWRAGPEPSNQSRRAPVVVGKKSSRGPTGDTVKELVAKKFDAMGQPLWAGCSQNEVARAFTFRARRRGLRRSAEPPLRIVAACGKKLTDPGRVRQLYAGLVVGRVATEDFDAWSSAAPATIFFDSLERSIVIGWCAPEDLGARRTSRIGLEPGHVAVVELTHLELLEVSHHAGTVWRSSIGAHRIAVLATEEAPRGAVAKHLRGALLAGARLVLNFTNGDESVDDDWVAQWAAASRGLPEAALVQCRPEGASSFVWLERRLAAWMAARFDFFEWVPIPRSWSDT